MAEQTWSTEQATAIDSAGEVVVSSLRGDGSARKGRTVWSVRRGDDVYVRSVNGTDGQWYAGVQARHQGRLFAGEVDADVTFVEAPDPDEDRELHADLDAAYRAKYGSSSAVDRITAARARATTLQIIPAETQRPPEGTPMKHQTPSATVKTPASNFTGDVWMNPVFGGEEDSALVVGLVRFTPGARTNWHSHANGQLLVCTDGVGLVVNRDGQTLVLHAGETVWTPPGEEHWHGGTADNLMCHYAILDETPSKDATTWLEAVTDEQYAAANQKAGTVA